MKRLYNIFFDKSGSVLINTAAVLFLMAIIFSLVYQFGRILIISSGVKEEVRNAAITAIADNYYPSFNGMREGNSGAYRLTENNWTDDINSEDIKNSLAGNYSFNQSGNTLLMYDSDGKLQYSISAVTALYKNASFASDDNNLTVNVSYTINVPVKFLNVPLTTFSFPSSVSVAFEKKF